MNVHVICANEDSVLHKKFVQDNQNKHIFKTALPKFSPDLLMKKISPLKNAVPCKSKSDTLFSVPSPAAPFHVQKRYTLNGLLNVYPSDSKHIGSQHTYMCQNVTELKNGPRVYLDRTVEKLDLENFPPLLITDEDLMEAVDASKQLNTFLSTEAIYFFEEENYYAYGDELSAKPEPHEAQISENDYTLPTVIKRISQDGFNFDKSLGSIMIENKKCCINGEATARNKICSDAHVPNLINLSQLSISSLNAVLSEIFLCIDELDVRIVSHFLSMLEEIEDIDEHSRESFYAVIHNVLNDYENKLTDFNLLVLANRNKSGNSGFSPPRKLPGSATVRTKPQSSGSTMHTDADSKSLNLQSCLEKAKLACTLQRTIGRMGNRAENFAAAKAYEQSIKDFEKSMKDFLKGPSESSTKCDTHNSSSSIMTRENLAQPEEEAKKRVPIKFLRRSDTFVVQDQGASIAPCLGKRRNTFVAGKECSQQQKTGEIKNDNKIQKGDFVFQDIKDVHIKSTWRRTMNFSDITTPSRKTSYPFRANTSNNDQLNSDSRRSSASRWQQSLWLSSSRGNGCEGVSNNSDCSTGAIETDNEMTTLSDHSQIFEDEPYSKEKTAQENITQDNKGNIKFVNGNHNIHSSSNELPLKEVKEETRSAAESMLCCTIPNVNHVLSHSQTKCSSLKEETVSMKEKSHHKSNSNIAKEEEENAGKLTELGIDSLSSHFNEDPRRNNIIANEKSRLAFGANNDNAKIVDSEYVSQGNSAGISHNVTDDVNNLELGKDQKCSNLLSLSCNICDSSNSHELINAREMQNCSGYKNACDCRKSILENPGHDIVAVKKLCFRDNKYHVSQKGCHENCPQKTQTEGLNQEDYNRWQQRLNVNKQSFPELSSDFLVPKVNWSSNDDDVDNLPSDKSPSDLLKHRQKLDINIKFQELNKYSQRIKKSKSPLRKRASTNTSGLVENDASVYKFHDYDQVTHSTEYNKTGTTNDSFIKLYRDHKGISLEEQIVTEELDKTVGDLNDDDNNVQILASVSQLFQARFEKCKEELDAGEANTTLNYALRDVANVALPESKGQSTSKDSNSVNVITTCEEGNSETSSQEKFSVTYSSTSTTSDEYVLPEHRFIKESWSENDMKTHRNNSKFRTSQCIFHSEIIAKNKVRSAQQEMCRSSSPGLNVRLNSPTNTPYSQMCHRSSPSVVLVAGTTSRSIPYHPSISEIPEQKHNLKDIQQADVERKNISPRNKEMEQRVMEVSECEKPITKSPQSLCFISLTNMQMGRYNNTKGREHEKCDKGQAERNKVKIKGKLSIDITRKTEAEPVKIYSIRSPPRCYYSNKQIKCSHPLHLSGNPRDGRNEIDCKETFPFSIVGVELDNASPYENTQSEFFQNFKNNVREKSIDSYGSKELTFVETIPQKEENKNVCKQKVKSPTKCLSLRGTRTSKCADRDRLPKKKSDGVKELTHVDRQSSSKNIINQDDCGCENSRCLQDESQAIRELRYKVDLLESILTKRNHSFCCCSNIFRLEDCVSAEQSMIGRHCPRCASWQNLIRKEQYTLRQHECSIRPNCCAFRSIRNVDVSPRNNLSFSRCLHSSYIHLSSAGATFENKHKNTSSISTASQTLDIRAYSEPLSIKECVHVDGSTQYGSFSLNNNPYKVLQDQVSVLSDNIQEIRLTLKVSTGLLLSGNSDYSLLEHNELKKAHKKSKVQQKDSLVVFDDKTSLGDIFVSNQQFPKPLHEDSMSKLIQLIQETLLSLHESQSHQRKEINEIKSRTEKIASCLEDGCQEKSKNVMDYDSMKGRIVELTSQRDAEKVFHKITRQALRALERDHDRLRQEYIIANCRRYKHSDGIVQNRIRYYMNNKDQVCCSTDGCSSSRETQITSEKESLQEIREDDYMSKSRKLRTSGGQRSHHQAQSAGSRQRQLTDLEMFVRDISNTQDTDSTEKCNSLIEMTNSDARCSFKCDTETQD